MEENHILSTIAVISDALPLIRITPTIQGMEVTFEVDTDAPCSLVPKLSYNKI